MNNESTLRAAFAEWFADSYGRPPAAQAVLTHVGFAQHILQLQELMQEADPVQAPAATQP